MDLHEILAFAKKTRVTELHFEADKQIKVLTAGKMQLLNLPALEARDIEELLAQILSPATLEKLRTTGQCDESVEVEGLGRFRVVVEGGTARIILPVVTPPADGPSSRAASERGPGAVPTFSERLRDFFGRNSSDK